MFQHETAEAARHIFRVLRVDEHGDLFWIVQQGRARAGSRAGNIGTNGHARVGILGRYFQSHRVVWLLTHGAWPVGILDHENRRPLDNRPGNLRPATKSLNAQNSAVRSDNAAGFRGVDFVKSTGRFRARVCVDGARVTVGTFETAEAADAACSAERKRLHPFSPAIN